MNKTEFIYVPPPNPEVLLLNVDVGYKFSEKIRFLCGKRIVYLQMYKSTEKQFKSMIKKMKRQFKRR